MKANLSKYSYDDCLHMHSVFSEHPCRIAKGNAREADTMYYWIMLGLAVMAEVASTIGMKYAATHSPLLGYAFMAVMISFSMYAFSRAVMHIPLAVSYAVWEGAGLFLIAMAGMLLFGEHLSTGQLLAVGLMMLACCYHQGPDKTHSLPGGGRA